MRLKFVYHLIVEFIFFQKQVFDEYVFDKNKCIYLFGDMLIVIVNVLVVGTCEEFMTGISKLL